MKTNFLHAPLAKQCVLVGSGLLAAAIAGMIMVAPQDFYSAYGIDVAGNTSLINELKAPAGVLFLAGVVMLLGAVRSHLTSTSLALAAGVYLAYGLSRIFSFAVDGAPDSALQSAAILELTIGAIAASLLFANRPASLNQHSKEQTGMNNELLLSEDQVSEDPVSENQVSENQDSLVLVVGGTGKTGRRVADRLADRGIATRIGSRSAAIPFDWHDADTWAAALDGVSAVYITYSPDLAIPGAGEAIQAFVDRAVSAGVRRLVLLSGRGEEEAQRCERIVARGGVEWTVVRASWFNQNFSEGEFLGMVMDGSITLPAANVPEPFVDVDDIADVVVAALTEDGHNAEIYEVTGPRLLTFADIAQEISRASGREVRFVQIPREAFAAAIADSGAPDDIAWLLNYLFETVLDGRNASLGDGVQRALGREPVDFTDYARRVAASGLWRVAA